MAGEKDRKKRNQRLGEIRQEVKRPLAHLFYSHSITKIIVILTTLSFNKTEMKSLLKLLITSALIIGSCMIYAQNDNISFGTPDTEWIYNVDRQTGFTRVFYDSDTVINNTQFNKFLTNRTFVSLSLIHI